MNGDENDNEQAVPEPLQYFGDENDNEQAVPEPLQYFGLPFDDLIGAVHLYLLRYPNNPPRLLFQLCRLNLAGEVAVASQKILTTSDVNPAVAHEDRLLMPADQVRCNILPFLNHNERVGLEDGIPIRVYDTNGRRYLLRFLQRNEGRYIITHRQPEGTRWRHVCEAIGLQAGDSIKLWTLRHAHTNELSFVIQKI